eukprot:CAMPEP_0116898604 /NCGR_PEP_ID=MMETSP0467-20121206/7308_1 /TAXON_ID=283647 /ORGANISM="Mesodinium pulex, Strain SPMC105" /LENGTH=79 /DNA_ID=CAMNT_0004570861 /DNA_START=164 /DNA_END=403 /DNA_ORIENTATION=-
MIGTALVASTAANAVEDLELSVQQVIKLQEQISQLYVKKEQDIKEFEAKYSTLLNIKKDANTPDKTPETKIEDTKGLLM